MVFLLFVLVQDTPVVDFAWTVVFVVVALFVGLFIIGFWDYWKGGK
jgi:hypothetical protein